MGEKISRILSERQGQAQSQLMEASDQFEEAWTKHYQQLKDEGNFEFGRELILDDFRQIELFMTTSQFLAQFSDLIENLFLGCKEAMSDEVHQDFVDIIVTQTQSIIQKEYHSINGMNRNFCKDIPLYLNKEDSLKNRITQMVFLMVMRISNLATEEIGPEKKAKWECSIRLQLSSDKTLVAVRPRRPCYRENQWQLPPNLSVLYYS